MPRPRPWAALTITHGHLSPRATSSPYSVDPAARRAVVNPAITGDLGAKARPAHRQGNGPGRSKPGTSGAMAKAPNVHARASPPPPRRPRLPARPARYAFLLTTFVTQRDAICRVTCCRPIESVGHHRSGGRRRVMWPPMLRSNGPVQLPAGLSPGGPPVRRGLAARQGWRWFAGACRYERHSPAPPAVPVCGTRSGDSPW